MPNNANKLFIVLNHILHVERRRQTCKVVFEITSRQRTSKVVWEFRV